MTSRITIGNENHQRIVDFENLQLNNPQHQGWQHIRNWEGIHSHKFSNLVDLPGPELIWVGCNYGETKKYCKSTSLPKIAFMGNNANFSSFEMGYWISLQHMRNIWNHNPPRAINPMTPDEWLQFRNGGDLNINGQNKHFYGYCEFDHTTRKYCYAAIVDAFFCQDFSSYTNHIVLQEVLDALFNQYAGTIQMNRKKGILDYIAITNGFIFPSIGQDQSPTVPHMNFEIQEGYFQRTVNSLDADIVFVFSRSVAQNEDLWNSVGNRQFLSQCENYAWKIDNTLYFSIPHMSQHEKSGYRNMRRYEFLSWLIFNLYNTGVLP